MIINFAILIILSYETMAAIMMTIKRTSTSKYDLTYLLTTLLLSRIITPRYIYPVFNCIPISMANTKIQRILIVIANGESFNVVLAISP